MNGLNEIQPFRATERIIFPSLSLMRQPHLQSSDIREYPFLGPKAKTAVVRASAIPRFFAGSGDALTFLWRETVFWIENMVTLFALVHEKARS